MNTCLPKSLNDVVIPKKEQMLLFYQELKQVNDFNMLFVGNRETCKTTVIELIISDFIRQNKQYSANKIVFRYNTFDEINLQSEQNVLHAFCQTNVNCNKIVYVDKIDFFNDANQQLLKIYMDKYNTFREKNKIFFIFEGMSEEKIRDVIKSRVNILNMHPLAQQEYIKIFKKLLHDAGIYAEEDALTQIFSYSNITITTLKNIVVKTELLNIRKITVDNLAVLCDLLNFYDAKTYFELLKADNLTKAIDVLMNMYQNGIDISDIYFSLYEYIKTNEEVGLYGCIKIICEYINQIYNGNYNRIMLVLLSYDIHTELFQNKK